MSLIEGPLRSVEERVEFVQRAIVAEGFKVKPSSRLDLGRKALLNKDGSFREKPSALEDSKRWFEASRDYTLFEFMFEHWSLIHSDPLASEKLHLALKDGIDSYANLEHAHGRDTQFELFIALNLLRGGADVWLEPPKCDSRWPDMRTRFIGSDFYIEVKRPKSRASLLDAVDSGVEQIAATDRLGALFIDTSLVFNPDHGVVVAPYTDDQFGQAYGIALSGMLKPFEVAIRERLRGSATVGIVFQDHQHRLRTNGLWHLNSLLQYFPRTDLRLHEQWHWDQFLGIIHRAWPDWPSRPSHESIGR